MRSKGNIYNPKPQEMPPSSSADEDLRLKSQAIEIACDIRFHRSFILKQSEGSGRAGPIRVTYSDCGRLPEPADGLEKPVLLWASGMFGGRYQTYAWDEIAQEHGVRLVAVDRPGIGGTDAVPLEDRIRTWLDIVPALLNHHGIKYISLAGHSAGTIYMLSLLMQHRHLLHPEKPYIALFGPWVPPQYSGRWTMNAARAFPTSIINGWAPLAKAVHQYIGPVVGASTSLLNATGKLSVATLGAFSIVQTAAPLTPEELEDDHKQKLSLAVQHLITKYVFGENIQGANDEALLCLDKGKTGWLGLSNALQKVAHEEQSSTNGLGKLRIQVFYGESDEMIGKGGTAYLDSLLKPVAAAGLILVDRFEVRGTDHNAMIWPEYGAPCVVMKYVCGATSVEGMDIGECTKKA